MPRLARTVFAGLPHHVTQRGNRREDVFFSDDDRRAYLEWLKEYCERHAVEILAYCLMTNHVHLVAVPAGNDGLQRALKALEPMVRCPHAAPSGLPSAAVRGELFLNLAGNTVS